MWFLYGKLYRISLQELNSLSVCSDRQDQCQNEPSPHSVSHPRSLLLCCYQDLCNHVDSPETRQRYNDSVLGE